jgi:5-methylcytosine-specific restriction enzyme subunit McrC
VETISIIEHESLPIVQSRNKGQIALSSDDAEALAKFERRLTSKIFSWGHHCVKFANHCGVISFGNLTLEILPKIHGKETDPGACRKALIRMLSKARRLKPQQGGITNVSLQKLSLLDYFILNFCNQLRKQLLQGMIHQYVEHNENLNVIRGRLRFEQQFKLNLLHKERLYCHFDDLNPNNPHNQVIKYVLRLLMRFSTGLMVRKSLEELLMRFHDISDLIATSDMVENLNFNRFTIRYEPIFEQCKWFIQGLHPDVIAGSASCLSILFDMNRLFELYVANIFRKLAWEEGFHLREQGPQKYMARRHDSNQQVFLMKPDMVLIDDEKNYAAIADAKWKLLDDREKKLGISQSDLYQIAGYANRYQVNRLALIYPKQRLINNSMELQLQGTESTVIIVPIDITDSRETKCLPF